MRLCQDAFREEEQKSTPPASSETKQAPRPVHRRPRDGAGWLRLAGRRWPRAPLSAILSPRSSTPVGGPPLRLFHFRVQVPAAPYKGLPCLKPWAFLTVCKAAPPVGSCALQPASPRAPGPGPPASRGQAEPAKPTRWDGAGSRRCACWAAECAPARPAPRPGRRPCTSAARRVPAVREGGPCELGPRPAGAPPVAGPAALGAAVLLPRLRPPPRPRRGRSRTAPGRPGSRQPPNPGRWAGPLPSGRPPPPRPLGAAAAGPARRPRGSSCGSRSRFGASTAQSPRPGAPRS